MRVRAFKKDGYYQIKANNKIVVCTKNTRLFFKALSFLVKLERLKKLNV